MGDLLLQNSTFIDNKAEIGGAVSVYNFEENLIFDGTVKIKNCKFYKNIA